MLVLAMEFSRSAPHRQPEIRAGGANLASGRTCVRRRRGNNRTRSGSLPQNGIVRSDTPRSAGRGGTAMRASEETAGATRLPPDASGAD